MAGQPGSIGARGDGTEAGRSWNLWGDPRRDPRATRKRWELTKCRAAEVMSNRGGDATRREGVVMLRPPPSEGQREVTWSLKRV